MNERDVFINCPFSDDYQVLFQAYVFSILRSGFVPRCALESDDGGEIRFEKICRVIAECRLGIHDISFTELDRDTGLPRFNMPLELGLFLGARKFDPTQRIKRTLILDREPKRYQAFISDIAGQDIHEHRRDSVRLIEIVAAWLRVEKRASNVPGGRAIARDFERFRADLPAIAHRKRLETDELRFLDLREIATEWILADASSRQHLP